MMSVMQKDFSPPSRFVDGISGRVAGWVLLLVWVASMAMPDDLAYTQLPMAVGLLLVLLCGLAGLLLRQRLVQLPVLSWGGRGGRLISRCVR